MRDERETGAGWSRCERTGYLLPDEADLKRILAEQEAERSLYSGHVISAPDGLPVYYRDYPALCDRPDTPVLCLAGLTRNSHDFHDLAKRLQHARRVVCPDYVGRGLSARGQQAERIKPTTLVGDILAVMAASHIGRCVIVGTSLGGLIACVVSVIRPTALAGIVLNDVGPEIGQKALTRIKTAISAPPVARDWLDAVRVDHSRFPCMPLRKPSDWVVLSMGSYEQRPDGSGLRSAYDVTLSQGTAGPPPPPGELWRYFLATSHVPALLIRGSISDFLEQETAELMARRHPDCRLVLATGFGHAPPIDYEPWSLEIVDFLKKIDATRK